MNEFKVIINQQQLNKILDFRHTNFVAVFVFETRNKMSYLCPFPNCNYASTREELMKHFLGIHFAHNQQQANLQERQYSQQSNEQRQPVPVLTVQHPNVVNQQNNFFYTAGILSKCTEKLMDFEKFSGPGQSLARQGDDNFHFPEKAEDNK